MFTFKRYLMKLIIFTIGLSTLPIILLCLFFYIKTSSDIQEKVNEGNILILEQTHMRIEQVLSALDLQIERLSESPLVAEALESGITPSKFLMVQQLHRSMSQVQTFDIGIRDVHLIDLNRSSMLNSRGYNPLSDAELDKILLYQDLDRRKFWVAEQQGWLNSGAADSLTIHLVKEIPAFARHPSGMLILEFSVNQLQNYLVHNNTLGEVVILDEAYNVLTAQNESVAENPRDLEVLIERLQDSNDTSGLYETSFGERQVGVAFQRSTLNGWIYLSIIPIELIQLESRQTGWVIVIACIVMLILAVMISLAGSHRMYSPIQRLYQSLFTHQERGRKKRQDEFHMIHESFANMQSVQRQMANTISNHTRQLEEYYVLKLIRGEIKPSQINEKLGLLHVNLNDWSKMAVLMIQIDTLKGSRYHESDCELLLFAINNIVGDLIPQRNRLLPIVAQSSQVTIVFDDPQAAEEFRSTVYAYANQIQNKVEKFLSLRISIGVSHSYSGLADVNKAYREAKDALKYKVLYGQKTILHIDDVQPTQAISTQYPKELERQILDAVKMANLVEVQEPLELFFEEISGQYKDYNDYQIAVTRFFINLIRLLQEAGITSLEQHSGDTTLLEQLHALSSVEDVQSWFKLQLIEPMIRVFEDKRKSRFQTISQEVIEMIHHNYDSDISLETCSNSLNYHPSYISKVLRQELGISFSDYLMQYRIKKAKEMLEETDLKIAEIAGKVGYNNSQNFIRSFRREVGTTPGIYRDEYIRKYYKTK